MNSFTHLDEAGQIHMVDVADKPETLRQATAGCRVIVYTGFHNPGTWLRLRWKFITIGNKRSKSDRY